MRIYRLQHPRPGFRGIMLGVDFHDGLGSTSSPYDAVKLVKEGCRLPDPEARAEIRVLAQRLGRNRIKSEEARRIQDAFERTPAYTARALARLEERKRNDPRRGQEELLAKQMRRHFGVRLKKTT